MQILKSLDWKHVAAAVLAAVVTAILHQTGVVPVPQPAPPAPAVQPAPAPAPAPPPRRAYGWVRPAADDVPERVFAAPPGAADRLPPAVQLMAAPAPEVPAGLPFDQGQLGSCGPNSAAESIMFADVKAGRHGLPPPSRLFIYYQTRKLMGTVRQDSGVSNSAMVRALATTGYCDEALCPYQINRFTLAPSAAAVAQAAGRKVKDYGSVPQILTQMKACLAAGKPFVFGFEVYESFESPAVDATGDVPLPLPGEQFLGGHDVLVTGFDDRTRRFTFLNHYGPRWGKGGFGTVPYAYATDRGLSGDFWYVGSGR